MDVLITTNLAATAIALVLGMVFGARVREAGYRQGAQKQAALIEHLTESNTLACEYVGMASRVKEAFDLQVSTPQGELLQYADRFMPQEEKPRLRAVKKGKKS